MPHTNLHNPPSGPCPPGTHSAQPADTISPPLPFAAPPPQTGCPMLEFDYFDRPDEFPITTHYRNTTELGGSDWNNWANQCRLGNKQDQTVKAHLVSRPEMCSPVMKAVAIFATNSKGGAPGHEVWATLCARSNWQTPYETLMVEANIGSVDHSGNALRISAFLAGEYSILAYLGLAEGEQNPTSSQLQTAVSPVDGVHDTFMRINGVNVLAAICPPALAGFKRYGARGQINSLHPPNTRLELRMIGCTNNASLTWTASTSGCL